MEYKNLGRTSLAVSRIGFGCMSLKMDNEGNESLLHHALDQGINYFDTADLYDKGKNEELLGRTFKNIRDKVIIATKAGNQWRKDGSGWDWNPRKDYILKCADESLRRLQTDYIDLYQLHGGTMEDPVDETIEAFEILKQQGKIRYYGLSSIRPVVIREWVKRSGIVSVMTQYSLLDRRPEETSLPFLLENNIAVMTRGTIAQGLLINKPPAPYLDHSLEEVKQAAEIITQVSDGKRTKLQSTVQYVLQHPAITTAIIGIRTKEQLEEALHIPSAPGLSDKEMQLLDQHIPSKRYKEHR